MPTQERRMAQERWEALWKRMGCLAPEAHLEKLMAAFAQPHRAYHTLDHVVACLAQFDLAHNYAERPDEVELALWFHDVVYIPAAPDNETQSACWAAQALSEGGVTPSASSRVCDLILATRHVAPPSTPDASLVMDIDLAILGAPPEQFADYERKVRIEYASVPEPVYRQARAQILESFLGRRSIYYTSFFHNLCESLARQNLARSLALLRRPV